MTSHDIIANERQVYTDNFFIFFLGRVVVRSPKIVINLPGTYEKLPCKGEPDRFSGQRDPLGQESSLEPTRDIYQATTKITTNFNQYFLRSLTSNKND